jgi:multiple sugar transport system permease protein
MTPPTRPFGSAWRLRPQLRVDIAGYLFIAPWLIHFLVLIAAAMIHSLRLSFGETDLFTGYTFVGLRNYSRMLDDRLFWQALRVTAIYTFTIVPLNVMLALMIAMLLNRKLIARGLWRLLFYMPAIVQGAAVAVLWGYVLNPRFGLLNQGLAFLGIDGPRWLYSETWALPGIILMGLWGAGSAMLLYLAGLQGIPTQLYEAADIDGANGWHRFWSVTLPMLTPTIFFNLVLNIIGSFQVFTQSYVLTGGGPNNATLTMVLYLYRRAFVHFDFGYAAALAWVLFLIILGFTILVVRSADRWVHYEGAVRS